MAFALKSSYIPLSSPDTLALISRLTQHGVPMDEAVEQVALINQTAKQHKQPAMTVLEDWTSQQERVGGRSL